MLCQGISYISDFAAKTIHNKFYHVTCVIVFFSEVLFNLFVMVIDLLVAVLHEESDDVFIGEGCMGVKMFILSPRQDVLHDSMLAAGMRGEEEIAVLEFEDRMFTLFGF